MIEHFIRPVWFDFVDLTRVINLRFMILLRATSHRQNQFVLHAAHAPVAFYSYLINVQINLNSIAFELL